jgi:hypothetical protein
MLECAELYAPTPLRKILETSGSQWVSMALALVSCPYPALVEFNTRQGRTLLTLAERSLEAALAAGASGGDGSSSGTLGGIQGCANPQDVHLWTANMLFNCLCRCLDGGLQAATPGLRTGLHEAKGRPHLVAQGCCIGDAFPRQLQPLMPYSACTMLT